MRQRRGSAGVSCLVGFLVSASCIIGIGCATPPTDTEQFVRDAVAAAHVEPAPESSPSTEIPDPLANPVTQPADDPAAPPTPDVGPLDRLGERPRLIRDAPPAARVELAKKLVNPISDLIRMPVEMSYEEGIGPVGAHRFVWRFQPFIPFRISENWNLISRTSIPVVRQQSPIGDGDDQFGIGDIGQSILLAPQDRKYIWAVGPTFLFPTSDERFIGLDKWAVGPSAIGYLDRGPWAAGLVAGHLWSFAGDDDRRNVNVTTLSPLLAYTTRDAFTFLLDVDAIYDWDTGTEEGWLVPINLSISKVRRLGRNLVSVGVAGRWYAESPENGPEWGVRVFVTYLFAR
jgi:hypothetical protein